MLRAAKEELKLTQSAYEEYLERLVEGDRCACRRIVRSLLQEGYDVRGLYSDLFQRSMEDVGDLWERQEISVAMEHLCATLTEGLLNEVAMSVAPAPHHGRRAVIACVAHEYHQIGARIVADVLDQTGWDCHFLGANTPLSDLVTFVGTFKVDLI